MRSLLGLNEHGMEPAVNAVRVSPKEIPSAILVLQKKKM
jgi:hypothetical protein